MRALWKDLDKGYPVTLLLFLPFAFPRRYGSSNAPLLETLRCREKESESEAIGGGEEEEERGRNEERVDGQNE